jgi:spoIIIJ-associated protein
VAEGDEFTGRTVDEAIEEAERALGGDRNVLDIEVLSQGSRGVFGIGAENARIRARRKEVATVPARDDGDHTPASSAYDDEEYEGEDEPQAASTGQPESREALAAEARDVLQNLLQSMNFEAEVAVRDAETPIMLTITGDNLGVLIGRRGDNLAALQFMVNLILSKNRRQWPKVVIDIENYRAKREESLRTLADRIAYRVGRNGRPFTLEAMPASDRRIIHLTLRDSDEVETYSIGEGPARRVVIAPRQR